MLRWTRIITYLIIILILFCIFQMTEECTETELTHQQPHQRPRFRNYKRWWRVSLYIFLALGGQSAATLLGRLYYDSGGNSKWMATFVQTAGFPVLLPLFLYFPTTHDNSSNMSNDNFSETKPKLYTLVFLYIVFGLIVTANDLMYSYGLLYLPISLQCSVLLLPQCPKVHSIHSKFHSPPQHISFASRDQRRI